MSENLLSVHSLLHELRFFALHVAAASYTWVSLGGPQPLPNPLP